MIIKTTKYGKANIYQKITRYLHKRNKKGYVTIPVLYDLKHCDLNEEEF